MGFRVPGKVAKRLVEVGQTVDVGQPLATLDEVDLKLQAEQAEAEFRAATGVQAQAAAAEARAKELRVKGWTTDAQMDQARAAADEARARLNRAQRSVELTNNSLSYATLVADTRGVVTATLIDAGQVVASGQTAVRVARVAEKEAVVSIPETLVGRAKDGVATVTLWSEPNKKYAAKLREIAPNADPATRTYLAKFSLPGAGDTVSLGMTATQLAKRLRITPQSVLDLEKREVAGTITIATLQKTAHALDCHLLVALVPHQGLEKAVEQQAMSKARAERNQIIHTMGLEAQGNGVSEALDLEKIAESWRTTRRARLWDEASRDDEK